MAQGIATVKKISLDGWIRFQVVVGEVFDELVVDFAPEAVGKQEILGLEHLFGCEVGDDFFVTAEISTPTKIAVLAFDGPARECSAQHPG